MYLYVENKIRECSGQINRWTLEREGDMTLEGLPSPLYEYRYTGSGS